MGGSYHFKIKSAEDLQLTPPVMYDLSLAIHGHYISSLLAVTSGLFTWAACFGIFGKQFPIVLEDLQGKIKNRKNPALPEAALCAGGSSPVPGTALTLCTAPSLQPIPALPQQKQVCRGSCSSLSQGCSTWGGTGVP